jgi:hypothetical protein
MSGDPATGSEQRWLADENFNNDIVRALLRREPDIDLVRVQDCGLSGACDQEVLAWAAAESRLILTHDVRTFSAHAYARVSKGQRMPGVFEVGRRVSIASAVEDILQITECSQAGESEGRVLYLPLR